MDAVALVGRAQEIATVRLAIDAATGGSGGVVLVTGEAGVGKSRLLLEAVRIARGGDVRVFTGRGAEAGGAYRPVSDALLRAGAGDLDPAALPSLRPYRAALARVLPGWAGAGAGEPEPTVDPVLLLGEGLVRLLREMAAC